MRLANQGVGINELPDKIEIPEELNDWYLRGYYGHKDHNVKAIFQFYLGWWDGNPTTYMNVSPEKEGNHLISLAGGIDNLIKTYVELFEQGEYRLIIQNLGKVVFAEPKNEKVRYLLADALEQYGYIQESGIRRTVYLQGAAELRAPELTFKIFQFSPDLMAGLTPEQILDVVGVRADHAKLRELDPFKVNIEFTDLNETRFLELTPNKVFANSEGITKNADLTIKAPKLMVMSLLTGLQTKEELLATNSLIIDGDEKIIDNIRESLVDFTIGMDIIAPRI